MVYTKAVYYLEFLSGAVGLVTFSKKTTVSLKSRFGNDPEFAKWLAGEEGIEYIKDSLGVDLVRDMADVAQSDRPGLDIVFKIDNFMEKAVVECQYGRTDQIHLSKLLSDALIHQAKYAIWIAEEIHPEHKNSIDWLNKNTNDKVNLYVFKALIEKIGDSKESFSLIPICAPDEIAKMGMSGSKEQTELEIAQLNFWQGFSNAIDKDRSLPFRSRKARPQQWYSIPVGSAHCYITIRLLAADKKVRYELWIPDNKEIFDQLYLYKNEVENVVGKPLVWDRKEAGVKASSISYDPLENFDIFDKEKRDVYILVLLAELKNHFYKIEEFIRNMNV